MLMDIYHGFFSLKPGTSDIGFATDFAKFMDYLVERKKIASWRLMRRKLGLGPREFGEFHMMIEVENLAQLDEAFSMAAARSGEYLTFRLGGEEYGIDILRVQEIRSYEPPTRIANAPSFIKGVVNLRGVIVPIIDLRVKLGCETIEYNAFTVVVVLNVKGRVVGAVVDSVSDVLALTGNPWNNPAGRAGLSRP